MSPLRGTVDVAWRLRSPLLEAEEEAEEEEERWHDLQAASAAAAPSSDPEEAAPGTSDPGRRRSSSRDSEGGAGGVRGGRYNVRLPRTLSMQTAQMDILPRPSWGKVRPQVGPKPYVDPALVKYDKPSLQLRRRESTAGSGSLTPRSIIGGSCGGLRAVGSFSSASSSDDCRPRSKSVTSEPASLSSPPSSVFGGSSRSMPTLPTLRASSLDAGSSTRGSRRCSFVPMQNPRCEPVSL